MHLEIVSHCWKYTRLAMYHLSSVYLNPPRKTKVKITIYYAKEDQPTLKLLEYFSQFKVPNVTWNWQDIPVPMLMRRAIGRNMTAQSTTADWVWYNDVDTLIGPGSVDTLMEEAESQPEAKLIYPRRIQATSDATGDRLIEKATGDPRVLTIKHQDFTPLSYNRAIGGVQIVRTSVLKQVGYCPQPKWQRTESTWKRTFEDVAFREHLGPNEKGQPINCPRIFRILHTKKGRDEKVSL